MREIPKLQFETEEWIKNVDEHFKTELKITEDQVSEMTNYLRETNDHDKDHIIKTDRETIDTLKKEIVEWKKVKDAVDNFNFTTPRNETGAIDSNNDSSKNSSEYEHPYFVDINKKVDTLKNNFWTFWPIINKLITMWLRPLEKFLPLAKEDQRELDTFREWLSENAQKNIENLISSEWNFLNMFTNSNINQKKIFMAIKIGQPVIKDSLNTQIAGAKSVDEIVKFLNPPKITEQKPITKEEVVEKISQSNIDSAITELNGSGKKYDGYKIDATIDDNGTISIKSKSDHKKDLFNDIKIIPHIASKQFKIGNQSFSSLKDATEAAVILNKLVPNNKKLKSDNKAIYEDISWTWNDKVLVEMKDGKITTPDCFKKIDNLKNILDFLQSGYKEIPSNTPSNTPSESAKPTIW